MATSASTLTPDQTARIHEDFGPTVIIVASLFIGLATTAVGLRFTARASRRMTFGLDDWLSLAALVC